MIKKIRKIFSDSKILILIGILSLAIGVFSVFIISKDEYREIGISMSAPIPLISVDGDNLNEDELSVLYKNERVEQPVLLRFRIKNTGTIPLTRQDFSENIKLIFTDNARVLNVKNSDDSILRVLKNLNSIEFYSNLFNPNDIVKIDLIIDGNENELEYEDIEIKGRVYGIEEITLRDEESQPLLTKAEQKSRSKEFVYSTTKRIVSIAGLILVFVLAFILLEIIARRTKSLKLKKYLEDIPFIWALFFYIIIFVASIFYIYKFIKSLYLGYFA